MSLACPHCNGEIEISLGKARSPLEYAAEVVEEFVNSPGPLIKLRHVEQELKKTFPQSAPSRNTIIDWIKNGTLLGLQLGKGKNYYVFQSSLDNLIAKLRVFEPQ